MFGATVLVLILVGIDPAIALFSSGLRTLAHLTVTGIRFLLIWGLVLLILLPSADVTKTDGIAAVAQGAMAGGLAQFVCSSDC